MKCQRFSQAVKFQIFPWLQFISEFWWQDNQHNISNLQKYFTISSHFFFSSNSYVSMFNFIIMWLKMKASCPQGACLELPARVGDYICHQLLCVPPVPRGSAHYHTALGPPPPCVQKGAAFRESWSCTTFCRRDDLGENLEEILPSLLMMWL